MGSSAYQASESSVNKITLRCNSTTICSDTFSKWEMLKKTQGRQIADNCVRLSDKLLLCQHSRSNRKNIQLIKHSQGVIFQV